MKVEFELLGSEAEVGFVLIPESDVERTLMQRLMSRESKGQVSHMTCNGEICTTVSFGKFLKDSK